MKQIEIAKKILNSKGKMFSVIFNKKDGTKREMTARLNVKKGVTGKGRNFEPKEHELISVYEMVRDSKGVMRDGQFRFVSIKGLISAKVGGEILTTE